jgi:hypothetical protein
MRLIIIILATVLAFPVFGQRKRGEEDIAPAYHDGVIYSLPRTGLRVNITAVKENFEPGPYSSYARQLLGINDAKNSKSVKWFITDIDIETFSEPDPAQVYKALGDIAHAVSLTPDGRLAGINSDVDLLSPDVAEVNKYIEKPDLDDDFSFADFNDSPIYTEGDSTTNYRPVRVSDDVKAAEAAARILECRLSRFHMAAGLMDEFHPDGKAYQVSLDELIRMEKNYMTLFTGRTTYSTRTFSFDFIPAASSEQGSVICRFSPEKGVLPAADLSGKPVTVKVEAEKQLNEKYSGLSSSEDPMAGVSGVYYRLPVTADVKIIYDLNIIASLRMVLPQFGVIAPLPEDLLMGDYRIEIYPETGAVKSVLKK